MPQSESSRVRRCAGRAVERVEARLLRAAHVVGSSTSYATIQAAVNAAPVGGTVTVDAGTYPEQVTIGKTLTVRGAQAGVDARGSARVNGTASTESLVTGTTSSRGETAAFIVSANDVTLDGFTVSGENNGANSDYSAGIVISPMISGTHVLNDVVTNNVAGLYLANYSATDMALVEHCYFGQNNNDGDNGGRGIYTDGGVSGGNLTNVTIDANTFYKNLGGDGTTGLEAGIALEAASAGKQSDIRITNNTFNGNGKATLFFNTTNCLIQGNYVTACQDQYSGCFRFEGNNANFTIRFNTVSINTGPGVAVDSKAVSGNSSGFVVYDNNFEDNNQAYDVPISAVVDYSAYTGTFDARYNFWNSTSGPSGIGTGTGEAVGSGEFNTGGAGWTLDATQNANVLWSPYVTGAITAPSGNNVYLRLAADGTTLDAWYNTTGAGTPDVAEPLSRLSMLAIDPISAGTSTITVDYSNGNPIPAGGLSVSSAYGLASVGLVVIGTTGGDAIGISATAVTVGSNPAITYTGLTGIGVNGNGGADTITQSAQPGGGAKLYLLGNTALDSLAINAGTYAVAAPVAGSGNNLYALSALTVASGAGFTVNTANATTDRTVLRVGTLSDSGTINLGGNDMILPGATLSTVTALARSGYASGTWAGTGLASSIAGADPYYRMGLGVIQNVMADGATPQYAKFDGQSVAATDVLVKYTFYGDANLSGTVDAGDYTLLDAGYIKGGVATGWAVGDFNYDQVVDGSDYTLADNAYDLQSVVVASNNSATVAVAAASVVAAPVAEVVAAQSSLTVANEAVTSTHSVARRATPPAPLATIDPFSDDRRKLKRIRISYEDLTPTAKQRNNR